MGDEFDMKDVGAMKKILRMKIHRDKVTGKLYLFRKKYIDTTRELSVIRSSQICEYYTSN